MKIRKSCYGCKALEYEFMLNSFCSLGYKIDKTNKKPLEPCPKPKTNSILVKKYLKNKQ